jgi:hypothetical protein
MTARLLIINCLSEYFVYIPMGTFGLCDYLSKKGFPVKLLNLALYRGIEREAALHKYLKAFQPTHVALILHWQETVEGFLHVGEQVRLHILLIRIHYQTYPSANLRISMTMRYILMP